MDVSKVLIEELTKDLGAMMGMAGLERLSLYLVALCGICMCRRENRGFSLKPSAHGAPIVGNGLLGW